jgi:hypothetical protein
MEKTTSTQSPAEGAGRRLSRESTAADAEPLRHHRYDAGETSESLQDFLARCCASASVIVIPAGRHTLSETVVVRSPGLGLVIEGTLSAKGERTVIVCSSACGFLVEGSASLTLRGLTVVHTRYREEPKADKKGRGEGDGEGEGEEVASLSSSALAALREFALERGVSLAPLSLNPASQASQASASQPRGAGGRANPSAPDASDEDVVGSMQRHYDSSAACVAATGDSTVSLEGCSLSSHHGNNPRNSANAS